MIKKEDAFVPLPYLKNAMEIDDTKEEWNVGFIKNLTLIPNAETLNRFIKAMGFWPTAWTKLMIREEEKRLKILSAHINSESGYLELDDVQLEGKKPTTWKQFKGAYGIEGFYSD